MAKAIPNHGPLFVDIAVSCSPTVWGHESRALGCRRRSI